MKTAHFSFTNAPKIKIKFVIKTDLQIWKESKTPFFYINFFLNIQFAMNKTTVHCTFCSIEEQWKTSIKKKEQMTKKINSICIPVLFITQVHK